MFGADRPNYVNYYDSNHNKLWTAVFLSCVLFLCRDYQERFHCAIITRGIRVLNLDFLETK